MSPGRTLESSAGGMDSNRRPRLLAELIAGNQILRMIEQGREQPERLSRSLMLESPFRSSLSAGHSSNSANL